MEERVGSSHPVLACAETIADAVKDVAGVDPVFMTTAQKKAALVELSQVLDQVTELRGRVLAAADDVALDDGSRTSLTSPCSARSTTTAPTTTTTTSTCGPLVTSASTGGPEEQIRTRQ